MNKCLETLHAPIWKMLMKTKNTGEKDVNKSRFNFKTASRSRPFGQNIFGEHVCFIVFGYCKIQFIYEHEFAKLQHTKTNCIIDPT